MLAQSDPPAQVTVVHARTHARMHGIPAGFPISGCTADPCLTQFCFTLFNGCIIFDNVDHLLINSKTFSLFISSLA